MTQPGRREAGRSKRRTARIVSPTARRLPSEPSVSDGAPMMKRMRSREGRRAARGRDHGADHPARVVGIFEFGRAYQTWQVLTNAAREGARMAVISGTTDADITARVPQLHAGRARCPNYGTRRRSTVTRGVALPGRRHRVADHDQLSVPVHGAQPGRAADSPRTTTTGAPITMQSSAADAERELGDQHAQSNLRRSCPRRPCRRRPGLRHLQRDQLPAGASRVARRRSRSSSRRPISRSAPS